MQRVFIDVGTSKAWHALRSKCVTSTDVAALFDLSPYCTKFELWHRKKNRDILEFEDSERMAWGRRLESPIAEEAAARHDWTVVDFPEFCLIPALRIGSSFDKMILGMDEAILEIKNVDGRIHGLQWFEDEAPPHIELQIQHQMLVSGIDRAKIAVLIGGNQLKIIDRELDESICNGILARCAAFWKSIDDNKPPKPDYGRDAPLIASIYSHAEPGKEITATPELEDLAMRYQEISAAVKSMEGRRAAIKAQLTEAMGDAETVIGDGWKIKSHVVGPTTVSYERKGYRTFRVYGGKCG